jgi:putative FmdB family regulatory protein
MPIYEYRCENGHLFEVMQRMTDDPLAACTTCDAPVQRVFYNTDYGTRRRNRELEKSGSDGADKSEGKAKEKAETKSSDGAKKADAKPAASKD